MPRQRPVLVAFLVLLLSASCLLPTVVLGQSATATLSGTITDANGAVVPAASVTVLNPATGLQRQATTNDQGSFTIPLLPPSTYTVSVSGTGFAPAQVNNVVLNVGDQKALQIQLKAGDVKAQVTIDSDAETIRTDGSVGTVINRQQIANMPLNGRTLQSLIQLTPGLVLTTNPGPATGTGSALQFSSNGQRTNSNYVMVDGVSANTGLRTLNGISFASNSGTGQAAGTTALGGTNSLASLDAIQEFSIQTSTFAAEFGRTPGAQISIITRGGTNEFHGSASEYFRNEAMDANDWFNNSRRLPKAKERQNLFGGVLGGPIRQNRIFFFGSYEGLRLQQPTTSLVRVPTQAARAGASAFLQPYLNALPLPNGRDFGNGNAEFAASFSNPGRFNIFAVRLDGTVARKLTGFFRFNHAPSTSETRTSELSTIAKLRVHNNSYTGGMTWIANPRVTADVRVNWTRNQPLIFNDLDTFGGAAVPKASDVFAPGRDPSKNLFRFNAIGFDGFFWGVANSDVQRQLNVVGTLAWVVTAHQFKFGVDHRLMTPILGATSGKLEILRFTTLAQIQTNTAALYQIGVTDTTPREPVFLNLSLFAQDTWRVGPRLTLTYGMRFERLPPPNLAKGRPPRTLLGVESEALQNPRLAPEGTPLYRSGFGSFAPRVGIAYQLGRRPGFEAVVRGGTGFFYDLPFGQIADVFGSGYPYFAARTVRNVPVPLDGALRTSPDLATSVPSNFELMDPNLRLPYTIQWNAAWQQSLGPSQSVTGSYVGAAGRRLLIEQEFFQQVADFPNSDLAILIQRPVGRSTYHALQLQFQRRVQRGVLALASYTLARSQDNGSFATSNLASTKDLLAKEWGPSDFDVRHQLSGAVTIDLPSGGTSALGKALLANWSVDTLLRIQSAQPVTPIAGFSQLPGGVLYNTRPDLVPGQPLYIYDPTLPGGRRFNPAAFTMPPPCQACVSGANKQGSFPRNGLRGFPASQVDLALRREFKLGERVRMQLRGELFNLFNHPNFGGVDSLLQDGINFGQPNSMLNRSLGSGLNALYEMGGPRSGQLSLKVSF